MTIIDKIKTKKTFLFSVASSYAVYVKWVVFAFSDSALFFQPSRSLYIRTMDKITDFFKSGADTIVSGLKTGTDKFMNGVKVGTDKVKEFLSGQGKEKNKKVGEKLDQIGATKPSALVDAASKYQYG